MTIKRYLVKSMNEAMTRIRYELGNDAIIVSSRRVRQGGWKGLFRGKMLEVTAAVDRRPDPHSGFVSRSEGRRESPDSSRQYHLEPPREDPPRPPMSQPQASPSVAAQPAYDSPQPQPQPLQSPRLSPPSRPSDLPSPPSPPDRERERSDGLEQEVRELKRMVGSLMEERAKPKGGRKKLFSTCLMTHLKGMDLDGQILREFTAYCKNVGNAEMDFRKASEYFSGFLEKDVPPERETPERIWAFIGPTGVGKTTTIAKIAARETLEGRGKVGLITMDTYRIGAVDQLRTYANILNIPLEVVSVKEDIPPVLERLRSCDRILIDSAGRSSRRKDQLLEVKTCLDEIGEKNNMLVVSATTRSSDLKMILDNYNHVGYDSVILTKLDETQSYGNILNISCYTDKPIRYVTTGQTVPEDIRRVTAENLLDYVLEGVEA